MSFHLVLSLSGRPPRAPGHFSGRSLRLWARRPGGVSVSGRPPRAPGHLSGRTLRSWDCHLGGPLFSGRPPRAPGHFSGQILLPWDRCPGDLLSSGRPPRDPGHLSPGAWAPGSVQFWENCMSQTTAHQPNARRPIDTTPTDRHTKEQIMNTQIRR